MTVIAKSGRNPPRPLKLLGSARLEPSLRAKVLGSTPFLRVEALALKGLNREKGPDLNGLKAFGRFLRAGATAYLAIATPDQTVELPNHELEQALDLQARVWTLVVAQHAELWRHGANLFNRDVDARVPPLNSRLVTKHTDAPVAPAA